MWLPRLRSIHQLGCCTLSSEWREFKLLQVKELSHQIFLKAVVSSVLANSMAFICCKSYICVYITATTTQQYNNWQQHLFVGCMRMMSSSARHLLQPFLGSGAPQQKQICQLLAEGWPRRVAPEDWENSPGETGGRDGRIEKTEARDFLVVFWPVAGIFAPIFAIGSLLVKMECLLFLMGFWRELPFWHEDDATGILNTWSFFKVSIHRPPVRTEDLLGSLGTTAALCRVEDASQSICRCCSCPTNSSTRGHQAAPGCRYFSIFFVCADWWIDGLMVVNHEIVQNLNGFMRFIFWIKSKGLLKIFATSTDTSCAVSCAAHESQGRNFGRQIFQCFHFFGADSETAGFGIMWRFQRNDPPWIPRELLFVARFGKRWMLEGDSEGIHPWSTEKPWLFG